MQSSMERPIRNNSLTIRISSAPSPSSTVAIFRSRQAVLPNAVSSTNSTRPRSFSLAKARISARFFFRFWVPVEIERVALKVLIFYCGVCNGEV